MGESWLVKHMPKNEAELVHKSAGKLGEFVKNFKKQKKKAVLLHGPTGSGKTSAAYAVASELGLEIVEVNASDSRNADQIESKVGNAIRQMSLFGVGKLILVDEIDGISGKSDRGGIPTLVKLIQGSSFPIVLTANDPFDKKFSTLRTKSLLVDFDSPSVDEITNILARICKAENIKTEESLLKSIARVSGGDMRAAINDLQILHQSDKLNAKGIAELDERSRKEELSQALVKVFKSTSPDIAVSAFDNVNTDLDQCFLWVDHNLPKEYKLPEDIARAYENMSKADIFRKRISRWQHWRFLVYVNALMTAGVAVSKEKKYPNKPDYERTTRPLKLWQAKMRYQRRLNIAQKIAEQTHCSKKRAIESTIPYLQTIFKASSKQAKAIANELDLDADEIAWLAK